MASGRSTTSINPLGNNDELNANAPKNDLQKKDPMSVVHPSSQQKLLLNSAINPHSSSSSIDSGTTKQTTNNDNVPSTQKALVGTLSSTTTESEFDSELDERYVDDNSLEPNKLPKANEKQRTSQSNIEEHKFHVNTEQLSRRVKHFRKLFKSEVGDDMPELIDSYVCAYQGDILLQGKMYITDRYLCFHSRIISYVTKHVYRWEQIENVTKERVAFIFPTAIGIQLKHTGKKIIYASFLQRDQAYDKIVSICSRFSNDINSLQDDDNGGHLTPSGTLKANRSNGKIKKTKSKNHCEIPGEPEQDDVLQMCLVKNQTKSSSKRRQQSDSSKNSFDNRQSSNLINSSKIKSSMRNSTTDSNLANNFNDNMSISGQANADDTISQNNQIIIDEFSLNPSRNSRNNSRDRMLSSINNKLSTSPQGNSLTDFNLSTINSNDHGLIRKYFRIIFLSIISVIKLFIEYLVLLYNQYQAFPIKTSLVLIIFIGILVVHSFYLIKLAYRIESRLQSLHVMWPSSMKNSLSSLKQL